MQLHVLNWCPGGFVQLTREWGRVGEVWVEVAVVVMTTVATTLRLKVK
jgi:hypothetical protein